MKTLACILLLSISASLLCEATKNPNSSLSLKSKKHLAHLGNMAWNHQTDGSKEESDSKTNSVSRRSGLPLPEATFSIQLVASTTPRGGGMGPPPKFASWFQPRRRRQRQQTSQATTAASIVEVQTTSTKRFPSMGHLGDLSSLRGGGAQESTRVAEETSAASAVDIESDAISLEHATAMDMPSPEAMKRMIGNAGIATLLWCAICKLLVEAPSGGGANRFVVSALTMGVAAALWRTQIPTCTASTANAKQSASEQLTFEIVSCQEEEASKMATTTRIYRKL